MKGRKSDNIYKQSIPPVNWVKHFKTIFNDHNHQKLPDKCEDIGPLDYKITAKELLEASYILKSGKSPGVDGISYELINCLLERKPEIILKLFNSILSRGEFVFEWQTSIITPIHKKGRKTEPSNYRGISLISCIANYFSAVFNNRLIKYLNQNNILSEEQLNRTSDALILVRNMIDFYCHKSNQRIFGCFVDFQNAFDSIPTILFKI